ncbi:ABC transporter permease [Paenibacillus anaericanus]|uniref:Putative hemin transport system permease protein HrtB n=1 Tax=Paenibacillus anaericanus TaxID=170367 RepID=A0A433YCR9_9BACL|nr:ABC transporter permease [Paenibacillus anaericanus]RUT47654.1 ABC transporter permease [Paenibacillus anaericanus]
MFLALREMRHSKVRYIFIMVIMLLVSFLVLFVTGLAKGLADANISAIESMSNNHFVMQGDAEQKFRRSQLGEDDLNKVRSIVGEENATPIAMQMSAVTVEGLDTKSDVTFFAVDMAGALSPKVVEGEAVTNDDNGNVLVDSKLADAGLKIGSTIKDQSTGMTLTVTGIVKNQSYSHTPVIFMNIHDWQTMKGLMSQDPEILKSSLFNAIALDVTSDQATALSGKVDNLEVMTQKEAVSNIPGYAEEQKSLLLMISFLYVIGAFVLAVFFYVLTIQKTSQFGILKAMGTKTAYLARSVVGQVLILSVVSLSLSLLLTWGLMSILPESMPFQMNLSTALLTSGLFVVTSLLGSLISVTQVAKVDALEAIGRVGA